MILRKQPLIDADWLLGPLDRKPSPVFRLDIGFGVLLTSAIFVGGWTLLSNRVISLQSVAVGQTGSSQNKILNASPLIAKDIAGEVIGDPIDQSLIRTVDRFVPNHHSAELNSIDQFANSTTKRQSTGEFEEIRAPIKLPDFNNDFALASAISAKDLRMDPSPMLPLELLSDSPSDNGPATIVSATPEWFDTNSAASSSGLHDNALQRPPQLTKVVRTVAYSGKLANDSAAGVSASEPPPLVTNGLRNPRLSSVDESESMTVPDAAATGQMLAGLDKRETGEVVRLLASVQPRIAGAALNELKRRKFTDDRIELAIELTSGNCQQRIESMNRLVSERSIAPLQWLVWMAEDEDRNVREHAVRMLASIPDEDARRQMRLLLNREKDLALQNLLRQACLSSAVVDAKRERR